SSLTRVGPLVQSSHTSLVRSAGGGWVRSTWQTTLAPSSSVFQVVGSDSRNIGSCPALHDTVIDVSVGSGPSAAVTVSVNVATGPTGQSPPAPPWPPVPPCAGGTRSLQLAP